MPFPYRYAYLNNCRKLRYLSLTRLDEGDEVIVVCAMRPVSDGGPRSERLLDEGGEVMVVCAMRLLSDGRPR